MKKTLLLLLALVWCQLHAFAGNDKGLARVSKIQGVEAYIMCEPLRDYEVLFPMETGLKATSLVTGGLVNEGVSDKVTQFVNRALKEADKRKLTVDAIVYTSGKTVAAVKFKDTATPATKGIGRVVKLQGTEVYVMNEPLRDYETIVNKSTGFKAKSALTGGLVNNSIEEDVDQYVTRLMKEATEMRQQFDAVVYSAGKTATGVRFKN